MLKRFVTFLAIFAVSGCAGRAANPIDVNQFGDDKKSCGAIITEIKTIENNVQRLVPKTNKSTKNIALGITGLIVPPAWLFMDLSSAEQEEINALKKRHDKLVTIAEGKQCNITYKNG
jgi:hypothetical protein